MQVELTENRLFIDLGTCQVTKSFDWIKNNETMSPAYVTVIGQIRADSNYIRRLAADLVCANRLAINLDSVINAVTDLSRLDIKPDAMVDSPQFVADAYRLVLLVPAAMRIYKP